MNGGAGRGRSGYAQQISRPTPSSYTPSLTSYSCHQLAATVVETSQGDVSQTEGIRLYTHWGGVSIIRHLDPELEATHILPKDVGDVTPTWRRANAKAHSSIIRPQLSFSPSSIMTLYDGVNETVI
jgi:hypothetical protein